MVSKLLSILIQNMLLMVLMNGCINGIKIIYISNNKKRINYDLWEKLYTLIHNFKEYITFQWVKAHSTCEYNNLVDNIARNQAENINHTT